jgi:hypothetical protein
LIGGVDAVAGITTKSISGHVAKEECRKRNVRSQLAPPQRTRARVVAVVRPAVSDVVRDGTHPDIYTSISIYVVNSGHERERSRTRAPTAGASSRCDRPSRGAPPWRRPR